MNDDNVTPLRPAMSRPRKPDARRALYELDPRGKLHGIEAGEWGHAADEFGLPPDCPIIPLGYDGEVYYFVNGRGGLSALTPNASGRGHIDSLFTPYRHFPAWAWPKRNRKGAPTGNYHADEVRQDLFAAAARAGGWNAVEKVRGRGAWLGDDGQLILHLGDKIVVGQETVEPGPVDDYLYPMRPPMDAPAVLEPNAGHQLLDLLNTWNWARPELDPEILLGWITAAMIGGALDRRPIIYVTGDKGTGKSRLQEVCVHVLGKGVIRTSDATRAGIDQHIQSDSIPVMVDELEAKKDPRRATAILELARTAYDGALTLRGGADHSGREFRARSCFWFSSINPPAMEPQDRSRMAVLEVLPFERGAKEPRWDVGLLSAFGRTLLQRAIEWHPRFEGLLLAFREALMDAGHDARGGTTWGVLAACSHLARFDDMPDQETLDGWAKVLHPKDLAEFEAMTPDWRNCIDFLLTNPTRLLEKNIKEARTVGSAIYYWRRSDSVLSDALKELKQQISVVGLSVVFPKGSPTTFENAGLFVPNANPGLSQLFDGTHWAAMSGGQGVWKSALRKMPRDWWRAGKGRVYGELKDGTIIQLCKILQTEDSDGVD